MKIYGQSISVQVRKEFGQLSSSWINVQRNHELGKLHLSEWQDVAEGDFIQCGTRCSRYDGEVVSVEREEEFVIIKITSLRDNRGCLLAEGASAAFTDYADVGFFDGEELSCSGDFGSAPTPKEYEAMKYKKRTEWLNGPEPKIVLDPEHGIGKLTVLVSPVSPGFYKLKVPSRNDEEIKGQTTNVIMRELTPDDIFTLCELVGLRKQFNHATHVDCYFASTLPQNAWGVGQRLLKEEDGELFVWDAQENDWRYPSDDRDMSAVIEKPQHTDVYTLNAWVEL